MRFPALAHQKHLWSICLNLVQKTIYLLKTALGFYLKIFFESVKPAIEKRKTRNQSWSIPVNQDQLNHI